MRRAITPALVACVTAIALAALPAGAVAAGEGPSKVVVGSETPFADFGVSPKALSKTKPTPVSATLSATLETLDGSQPPALSELSVELDRRIDVDLAGIPDCPLGLQIDPPEPIEERCRNGILGSGTATARIAFPEQLPIGTSAHLLLVKGNNRKLAVVASFGAPVSGTVLWPISIEDFDRGRFGSRLRFQIPKLANGAGSLTRIDLRLPLRRPGGEPGDSVLSARRDDGRLQTLILGTFVTGETTQDESVRACTPTA